MQAKHLYLFNYNTNENDLCKFESKFVFEQEEKNKLLFSNKKIEPSCSAFIKKRVDILAFSEDYSVLIDDIKKKNITIEAFKVEYLVLDGDQTEYNNRLKILKDIGFSIEGDPDYYHPIKTFAICKYNNTWYFGELIKNSFNWHKHKSKPCSYSNSISVSIAKVLANVASKADKTVKLLDACCGVGTILLEACFAGYNIEGCDINPKVCAHARKNLAHFNYSTSVYYSDVANIQNYYDAAIIDLPYNLFSHTNDQLLEHIIISAAKIAERIIIVSTSDISKLITKAQLQILDYCSVNKIGKGNFNRKIWVCKK